MKNHFFTYENVLNVFWCIFVRLKKYLKARAARGGLHGLAEVIGRGGNVDGHHAVDAVSYTHLDVYKRQPQRSRRLDPARNLHLRHGRFRQRQIVACQRDHLHTARRGLKPVSYTHLDIAGH